MIIGKEAVSASDGETIDVLDPSTGETFATVPFGTERDVDKAVRTARQSFETDWGHLTATERGRILMSWSNLILRDLEKLAELECRDTGKPISQANSDIRACARYFEYYGSAADKIHGQTIPYSLDTSVMAIRVPLGVTAHIIPWNYPAQIYGRSVAASLAAGNACVCKPAELACMTPLALTRLGIEAGLPAGALNIVTGDGARTGSALAAHPGIDHISFTGSNATGSHVAQAAARNHVPVTLELGGKSPQILFSDANLKEAIPTVVNAIIQNGGQTCTAGSRVLIHRDIYDEVIETLAARIRELTVGPGASDPHCGPLISGPQRDRVQRFVKLAESDKLRIAASASLPDDLPAGGFYLAPMLIHRVPLEHQLEQQEIFGPILTAYSFRDEDDAVSLANGTPYGLAASVWTQDGSRALRVAHRIQAGQVFINNYGAGGGIELPFGGVKHSGHGREKGFEGLLSFTTIKTITTRYA
ncbi:aldehyde dehydrogenase family protein [Orrella marina]|uniref:Aldehyde dehydrogenase n=1 Tax=Orrella marina TaxID=2163011 RepID=A0A2R4XP69_9BURK|nr:aldehyde dehydrogenase family protein [Orrella marina]AWB35596.1 aldehyde dehydrogenase [Orrella marina]